jgi:hypothetical protein
MSIPPLDAAGRRRAARWLLGALALSGLIPGAFAAVAPHAFYDAVLGVDLLGPYNQHLLTDIGALYLGFGLLFAWAAVTLGRELALAACAGWALTQLLHFAYHVTRLADFTLTQAIEQTAGLAAYLLLLLAAACLVGRCDRR